MRRPRSQRGFLESDAGTEPPRADLPGLWDPGLGSCGTAPPLPTRLPWASVPGSPGRERLCLSQVPCRVGGSDAREGDEELSAVPGEPAPQPASAGGPWRVLQEGSCSPRRNLQALSGSFPGGGWGWGALNPGWALSGGTLAAPELPTHVSTGCSRACTAVSGDPSLMNHAQVAALAAAAGGGTGSTPRCLQTGSVQQRAQVGASSPGWLRAGSLGCALGAAPRRAGWRREGLCNNLLLKIAFKDSRWLSLLVCRRCLQWCLEAGAAEGLDCGFRRWAPPRPPLSYPLVIWDPDAAQEPGAIWGQHGQGSWSCGSTFGIGNVSMASAPPSPPPGTRLTGEVPPRRPWAAPAPPCAARCSELPGADNAAPSLP